MAKAGMAASAHGRVNTGPWWDPFRFLWRLFTSVRFAFALTGSLALAGLLGVLIPQVPIVIRGNDVAVGMWLRMQEGRFGPVTDAMNHAGLFNVFNSWWFRAGMGVLVVSVTVCTANRLPPTLRNVFRPRERVPGAYFDRAKSRLDAPGVGGVAAVERALRKRRYRVKRFEEEGVAYLFADRYPWAQLATFVSHLGLIVVLAGVVVSLLLSSETQVLIGEGTSRPVGGLNDADFMKVQVLDTVEGRDDRGRIVDYHTDLAVYRNGAEVCRGRSTVNSPLSCEGYRFHQSFFDARGAQLAVVDAATGRKLYDETLMLTDTMPLPEVAIRDTATGAILFQGYVPLTDTLGNAQFGLVRVPQQQDGELTLLVGVRPDDARAKRWSLVVFEFRPEPAAGTSGAPPGDERPRVERLGQSPERIQLLLPEGGRATARGLEFAFPFLAGAPATTLDGLPGGTSALLQMPIDNDGRRYASIVGLGDGPLTLRPGESREIDGQRITFEQRDFAGITVKRDPGSKVIWIAGGMLLLGLVVTFYAPRRRLWAKIAGDRVQFAGVAERTVDFRKEMRAIARDAGSPLDDTDDDDDTDTA